MEPVFRKEAIRAITTLNNFLLQDEKCTPDMLRALQKVRDEFQANINFSKKKKHCIHVLTRLYSRSKKCELLIYLTDGPKGTL